MLYFHSTTLHTTRNVGSKNKIQNNHILEELHKSRHKNIEELHNYCYYNTEELHFFRGMLCILKEKPMQNC